MSEKHTLLMSDSNILVFQPELSKLIGLNESIILQQIHYWIENGKKAKRNFHEGKYWVYNSYDEWQRQFPFWSKNTIIRALKGLEDKNILISGNFNKKGFDKTKWYSIDYNNLEILLKNNIENTPCTQNELVDYPNWVDGNAQNGSANTIDFSKTSSKNSFDYMVANSNEYSNDDDFSFEVLNNQIEKMHKQLIQENGEYFNNLYTVEEYQELFKYFYQSYYNYTGHEHTKLKNHHIKAIMESFPYVSEDIYDNIDADVSPEENLTLIDAYFQQPWNKYKDVDPTILHFMSGNIRGLRYFETLY